MSTNETSNEESSVEDSDNGEPTTDLTEHRSYNLVLKMVLWGESREDIYRRLTVNSVPKEIADQLYALAREDRIRTIRSDCFHDLMIGLGLIAAAVVTFADVGMAWASSRRYFCMDALRRWVSDRGSSLMVSLAT
ncbi:hypothetical protein HZ994_09470 [Akkermansiaceae bacterium]|nr:hypothetical protein HZ994_09470 [Akkermansiaceae bacterium]